MNAIKFIFIKIGNGILAGIGFALVLLAFYWGMYYFFERDANRYEANECYSLQRCDEDQGLSVNIISDEITSQEFVLLGEVLNEGESEWGSVNIKAELFDENDVFIEECKHFVDEKVSPGSKVYFKLDCAQCSAIQLEKYHSYKVKITDANSL